MSDLIQTGDQTVDIKKEADKTTTIANKVIEVLPKILNGNLKLLQYPELCHLTLTYALYGKLVEKLKRHKQKQSQFLPGIIKFLFPDLVQFLPTPVTNLSTQVRHFIQKAKRTGDLGRIYEPILKFYATKCSSEWADFTKYGITQRMLVTGPLLPLSGCQMELKNRHVLLLLNLRNKYCLCWVKVVPQWLRFFGILHEDDCVRLQDIKSHWVGLGVQANNLSGNQLQEFLDALYSLPKSFIKKNIETVTNASNFNSSDINKTTCASSRTKKKSPQKEVNLLRSRLRNKNREIFAYKKKLKQKQDRLEDLSTGLCKMRLEKNYWYTKYHTVSGINLFDEVTEFSADLAYAQKIRKGARYIKRIVQLKCSDSNSQFVESMLDERLIEVLLEKILTQGVNFDRGSNILLEILQELAQHSQEKSAVNLKSQESKNSAILESLLMNNQIVPYGNRSATTKEVVEIHDSDSSSVESKIETNKSRDDADSTNVFYDTTPEKSSDFYDKTDPDGNPETNNVNNQLFPHFLSSKNSISSLSHEEQMLHNSYIFSKIITHKRAYNANDEGSKDSGHASHKDVTCYQPNKKALRLQRQTPSSTINSNPDSSYDPYSSPPVLNNETCFSPTFKTKESIVEEIAKNLNRTVSSPSGAKNKSAFRLGDDLWPLGDKYVSSFQSYSNLETCFEDPVDTDDIILVNRTTASPNLSPPCLIFENPDYQLSISD